MANAWLLECTFQFKLLALLHNVRDIGLQSIDIRLLQTTGKIQVYKMYKRT